MNSQNLDVIDFEALSLHQLEFLKKKATEKINELAASEDVLAWKVAVVNGYEYYFEDQDFEKARALLNRHLDQDGSKTSGIRIARAKLPKLMLEQKIQYQIDENLEEWL